MAPIALGKKAIPPIVQQQRQAVAGILHAPFMHYFASPHLLLSDSSVVRPSSPSRFIITSGGSDSSGTAKESISGALHDVSSCIGRARAMLKEVKARSIVKVKRKRTEFYNSLSIYKAD
jgi:hypothetical protein